MRKANLKYNANHIKALFLVLLFVVPTVSIIGQTYLTALPNEVVKIDRVNERGTAEQVNLPLYVIENLTSVKNQVRSRFFEVFIHRCEGEDAIYIPYYDGEILLNLDESPLLLDGNQSKKPTRNAREQLIKLKKTDQCMQEKLVINSFGVKAFFFRLAPIYIGNYDELLQYQNLHHFLERDLRIISFTITLISLIATVFFPRTGITNNRLFFLVGIIIYLMLGASSAFFRVSQSIISIQYYLTAILPVLAVFLKRSGLLSSGSLSRNDSSSLAASKLDRLILITTGLWILAIFFLNPQLYYIQFFNTFFSVFIFLAYFAVFTLRSTISFLRSMPGSSFFVPIALNCILANSVNELMVRFFGLGQSLYIPSLAVLPSTVITAFILLKISLADNKSSKIYDEQYKEEKRKIFEKLNIEHAEALTRVRTEVRNEELKRFHAEMHDGLSAYLSMIVFHSYRLSGNRSLEVRLLSQAALGEIRLILGLNTMEPKSFFRILDELRQISHNTLKEKGVTSTWAILDLIDKYPIQQKHALDFSRIILEALNNAIFRSGCSKISVKATFLSENYILVTIENSGGTSYNITENSGMGTKNMMKRSKRIGANFSISSMPTGALISLALNSKS